ncbi:hypothetical protein QYE76_038699 [Lolium multiflorum]|uniref:Eukaryotic translation initiation factor 2 subunit beta n=1 Tax=Lolium multiflorum TaxID=4521 RepID=A0AAD8WT44_LOLMU|nr:hypothetical protein QYE76_038699 [Lolium multiflorum]
MASAAMASWREEDPEVVEEEQGESIVLEGEDTEENYEQLLGRLYSLLGENNPGLAGRTHMTVMTYPILLREGTKKTVFVNFMDSCKKMRRQPKHVMDFLLSEMAATGSLDGEQRLVVKRRFSPRNIEALLRRYIYEYVICNGCKGTDTTMSRENRLLFLRCEQCGSSRSVAPIKAGYIARVTRVRA